MIKIFSLYIIFFLTSCVAIPKKYDFGNSTVPGYSKSCEKVGVAVSFTGRIYSDFHVEVKIDSSDIWRGSKNLSFYIINKLNEYRFKITTPKEITPHKFFINFIVTTRNYKNLFQRTTLWMSDLTLGLLPGWGDGEFYLIAEVYDHKGDKIKDYTSSTLTFDYYHGLIFLPINSYEHTLANLDEKYLPHMTAEIIEAMIKDNLFNCT